MTESSATASETPTPLEDFAFVRDALRLANFVGDYNMARQDSLAALARLEARIAELTRERDDALHLYKHWQQIELDTLDRLAAAEARCEALTAALREIAEHGCRCDLNPTRMVYAGNEAWAKSDSWWVSYLRGADESVRSRARVALATSEQAES